MRRRRFFILGVFFLLTALLVGAGLWFVRSRTAPVPYRLVMCGGRNSMGDFSISSGNVFLVSGKPAVLFGTVKKPGAQEELTCVLVFRRLPTGLSPGPSGLPFHDVSLGSTGEQQGSRLTYRSRHTFTINGKRIDVTYEVELNETKSAVTREVLTAGGERKELAAGRVLLVNLDGESPAYKQERLVKPPTVAPLEGCLTLSGLRRPS